MDHYKLDYQSSNPSSIMYELGQAIQPSGDSVSSFIKGIFIVPTSKDSCKS
jgi:hypothetical protein